MGTLFGIHNPVLKVLNPDGTTLKTLYLPITDEAGCSLEWDDLGLKSVKKKLDGTELKIYKDASKRYVPIITFKYKVYNETITGKPIGPEDGQTPTLEQLLSILSLYENAIAISPDPGLNCVPCYLSKNISQKSIADVAYQDVELSFKSLIALPSRDLTTAGQTGPAVYVPTYDISSSTLTATSPIYLTTKGTERSVGIKQATQTQDGYLSAAEHVYLFAKLDSTAYTATDVLSKVISVDGAGSSLDADLLDGHHGSYYLTATAQAVDSACLNGQPANYYQTALGFTPANLAGDTFTGPVSAPSFTGDGSALTGTAAALTAGRATTLATARTIALAGDAIATGVAFDGSASVTLTTSIADTIITAKLLTNYALGTNTAVSATDTILVAFGKMQAQLNNKQASGSYAALAGSSTQAFAGSTITAATQFTGPGTGLTGTAASLTAGAVSNISGNTGLVSQRLTPASMVDGLTSANFRTTLFGSPVAGSNIATARWNTAPSLLSTLGSYGTMLAWGASDTHGFIAINYSGAGAIIGGGNADQLNWTAKLLTDANFVAGTNYLAPSGSAASLTNIRGKDTLRFFYEASITSAVEMPAYRIDTVGTISAVRCYRNLPTTEGSTTISIRKNGSEIYSVVAGTGDAQTWKTISTTATSVAVGDTITAVVVTAGGASKLTIQLELTQTV